MKPVDAQPYPWPWDGDLSPSRMVVVVAGGQQYWRTRTVDPGSHLRNVERLLSCVRPMGVPVVWVRHGGRDGRARFLPARGSIDSELVPELGEHDIVVEAAGLDGCYGGPLDGTLRSLGRDLVVLCGLGLEAPVHSTLRSLNDRGYECLTLGDAASPCEPATAMPALSIITFSFGIFGAVASTASLIEALTPEAHLS